jgi:ABC-type amino acid transport substrate-binding protein
LTPVHAHVAAVLQARPELAERHGLALQLRTYGTGKLQGEEVENGTLDAFFSCEVPAIRMLEGRPDAWVVGSPGVLGRIAVVSRVGSLAELAGKRVGLSPGSTPAMDWEAWSASTPGAQVVPLDTDALQEALASGQVDAIVGWDPWVERWRKEIPGAKILAERPFRSVLAVSSRWMEEARNPGAGGQPPSRSPLDGDLRGRGRSLAALGAASPSGARVLPMLAAQGPSGPNRGGMPATPPGVAAPGPVARLVALVGEALAIAARDRPRWDAEVAKLSGWSVEVVRAVADQDPLLAPCGDDVPCAAELPGALLPVPADREGLARAGRYARAPFPGEALVAEALLEGKRPQPRPVAGHMPGPPKTPPGVPPPMPPVPGR